MTQETSESENEPQTESEVETESEMETDEVTNEDTPQMFINGVAVDGYKTFEEALESTVAIATKELTLSATDVSDDISRISVQLGNSNGQTVGIECEPLTQSSNWTQVLNIEDYEGEILVLNLMSELGFAGGVTNLFIAISSE